MRKLFFIFLIFFGSSINAETFLFGHDNIKLGMDKERVLRLINLKKIEEGAFPNTEYVQDNNLYLINNFEFNREIGFIYNKVNIIQLHTKIEYKNITSIEEDLDNIINLFDAKANALYGNNGKNKVKIIEGKEKTYPQKSFYKDEIGVEYQSSEVCLLNNDYTDITRKYEFENSNFSLRYNAGNCFNRNDLFYLDITIWYRIDGMGIYMKEYLKDNPPKKTIKKSNF